MDRPTSLEEAGPSSPQTVPNATDAAILARWEKKQPEWITELQWCATGEDFDAVQPTIDLLPDDERVLALQLFTWMQTMTLLLDDEDADLSLVTNCPIALPSMQRWIDRKRNEIRLRRGETFVDALPKGLTDVTTVGEKDVPSGADVAGETLARNMLERRMARRKRKQTG